MACALCQVCASLQRHLHQKPCGWRLPSLRPAALIRLRWRYARCGSRMVPGVPGDAIGAEQHQPRSWRCDFTAGALNSHSRQMPRRAPSASRSPRRASSLLRSPPRRCGASGCRGSEPLAAPRSKRRGHRGDPPRRNRACLAIGMAGAYRRSEQVRCASRTSPATTAGCASRRHRWPQLGTVNDPPPHPPCRTTPLGQNYPQGQNCTLVTLSSYSGDATRGYPPYFGDTF